MKTRTKNKNEVQGNYKERVYFEGYYIKEREKPWFYKSNLKKGMITMVNRLRANHYNLG